MAGGTWELCRGDTCGCEGCVGYVGGGLGVLLGGCGHMGELWGT